MVVLIVDTSALIIERLLNLITETKNVSVIFRTMNYGEAILLCKATKPDIVLLDMKLPEQQSFNLFRTIREINTETAFIILYNEFDSVTQLQYQSLQADYMFDKYHEFDQIPAAINSIATNKKSIELI